MIGMDRTTGKSLQGVDHLRQSIADILTTPIGSRLMRRDYGSELPDLLDQPVNGTTQIRLYAATATALMRWEPRLRLQSVRAMRTVAGQVLLDITGQYLPDGGKVAALNGIEVA